MSSGRLRLILQTLALAAIPFLFPLLVPWMHGMDLATFNQWAGVWAQSPKEIYTQSSCNYPAVGAFFSAGVLAWFKSLWPGLDFWALMGRYRLFLAAFDAANAILVFRILLRFGVSRAWLWALVIAVLPSSWAPTSVWGQIDGVTQFFLLLWFYLWMVPKPGVLGAIAFAFALLTKQLTFFAVPMFMAWVWVYGEMRLQMRGAWAFLRWFIPVAVWVWAVLLLPESYFTVPQNQFSTLAYVFTGDRSDHYKKVALNGFNVWTLFVSDPRSPSFEPLVGIFTPFQLGVMLYFAAVLTCGFATARAVARLVHRVSIKSIAGFLLLLMALLQLSVNVWLTGTHERYLAPFYAFAIAGALISKRKRLVWILCAGAVAYGCFVLLVLDGSSKADDFQPLGYMRFLAVTHLCLWFVIARALFQQARSEEA